MLERSARAPGGGRYRGPAAGSDRYPPSPRLAPLKAPGEFKTVTEGLALRDLWVTPPRRARSLARIRPSQVRDGPDQMVVIGNPVADKATKRTDPLRSTLPLPGRRGVID